MSVPFSSCFSFNCTNKSIPVENDCLDIVVIAFNEHSLLKLQIEQLRKHLKGINFTFFVADNSSQVVEQKKIQDICKDENIGYIKLPKSKELDKRGSYSHGAALNWVYYHFIRPRNAKYFSFLDHDIFPTKDICIKEKIVSHRFYGRLRIDPPGFYYLWPGISFWESSYLTNVQVNFMPCKIEGKYLDTGGSMWPIFFEKIPRKNILMPTFYRIPLEEFGYDESDFVDFFDDCWFHARYTGKKNNNILTIKEIIQNHENLKNRLIEKWIW